MAGLNEALLPAVRLPARPRRTTPRSIARRSWSWSPRPRRRAYREREAELGPDMFHRLERWIMLGARVGGRRLPRHRPALEGSPPEHGSPQGGHRAPRLRPARSAHRVQEGSLRHVPGDGRAPEGGWSSSSSRCAWSREDAPVEPVASAAAPARWQRAAAPAASTAAAAARATVAEPRARRRPEGRPQRPVPVRLRQEVQEVLPPQGSLIRPFASAGKGSAPHPWWFFSWRPIAPCVIYECPLRAIAMRLQQIAIHGFKSFAEKTEVAVLPGITCIVGPNGCGKSNVADAIRWALGEQSPKPLRGQRMEDVIFHGSASRKPDRAGRGRASSSTTTGTLSRAVERGRGRPPPVSRPARASTSSTRTCAACATSRTSSRAPGSTPRPTR